MLKCILSIRWITYYLLLHASRLAVGERTVPRSPRSLHSSAFHFPQSHLPARRAARCDQRSGAGESLRRIASPAGVGEARTGHGVSGSAGWHSLSAGTAAGWWQAARGDFHYPRKFHLGSPDGGCESYARGRIAGSGGCSGPDGTRISFRCRVDAGNHWLWSGVNQLIDGLMDGLIDVLMYWLIDWLTNWLIDWLIDCLKSNKHKSFCVDSFVGLLLCGKNVDGWAADGDVGQIARRGTHEFLRSKQGA